MNSGKKRKKQFYINQSLKQAKRAKLQCLESGMTGFLLTCNNNRKKETLRDAYSLLNEYADKLYGPEQVRSYERNT